MASAHQLNGSNEKLPNSLYPMTSAMQWFPHGSTCIQ